LKLLVKVSSKVIFSLGQPAPFFEKERGGKFPKKRNLILSLSINLIFLTTP